MLEVFVGRLSRVSNRGVLPVAGLDEGEFEVRVARGCSKTPSRCGNADVRSRSVVQSRSSDSYVVMMMSRYRFFCVNGSSLLQIGRTLSASLRMSSKSSSGSVSRVARGARIWDVL